MPRQVEHAADVRMSDFARKLNLLLEAPDHARVRSYIRQQRLERHPLVQLQVARLVHFPHAAAIQIPYDTIAPRHRLARAEYAQRRVVPHGAIQRARSLVLVQHAPHLLIEAVVVSARRPQHRLGLVRRAFRRPVEDLTNLAPALRTHWLLPPSSNCSQALAEFQSRLTVRTEIPNTSAISSSVNPPK